MRIFTTLGFSILLLLVSCGHTRETESVAENEGFTPVTVTNPTIGELTETMTLNAVSSYLIKTSVKSEINGYIQKVHVRPGQSIKQGDELFVIKSREAQHLGNTINKLDTAFHFDGSISIKSPSDGSIDELSFKVGDYVQDNEILASISDRRSLVFILEIPYELVNSIQANRDPGIVLPDGVVLKGTMGSALPAVDPVSQTLPYIVNVKQNLSLPENLIASVKYIVRSRNNVTILPKESVLTDETQANFWVMKLVDSSTAVKVIVYPGIVTTDKVEIKSPLLLPSDIILLTGNYGLPDTAKVKIENRK
jgi:multidrug efflux pump subunit AcrA (membrane-fusion protein)